MISGIFNPIAKTELTNIYGLYIHPTIYTLLYTLLYTTYYIPYCIHPIMPYCIHPIMPYCIHPIICPTVYTLLYTCHKKCKTFSVLWRIKAQTFCSTDFLFFLLETKRNLLDEHRLTHFIPSFIDLERCKFCSFINK